MDVSMEKSGNKTAVDMLSIQYSPSVSFLSIYDCNCCNNLTFEVFNSYIFIQEQAQRLPHNFGTARKPSLFNGRIDLFEKQIRD
jgi:hypothetical protein